MLFENPVRRRVWDSFHWICFSGSVRGLPSLLATIDIPPIGELF